MGIREVLFFRKSNLIIETTIRRAVKISSALTKDFLVYPFSSHFETDFIRNLFYEPDYREAMKQGFLQAAVREPNNREYLLKKQKQYFSQRNVYPGYYDKTLIQYLDYLNISYFRKTEDSGVSLYNLWKSSLNEDSIDKYWNSAKIIISDNDSSLLLATAEYIKEKEEAFTWYNFERSLKRKVPYNYIIQKNLELFYLNNYLSQYNLKVLTRLPHTNEILNREFNSIDIRLFEEFLRNLGILKQFYSLNLEHILDIRLNPIFKLFIEYYFKIIAISKNYSEATINICNLFIAYPNKRSNHRMEGQAKSVNLILSEIQIFIPYLINAIGELTEYKRNHNLEKTNLLIEDVRKEITSNNKKHESTMIDLAAKIERGISVHKKLEQDRIIELSLKEVLNVIENYFRNLKIKTSTLNIKSSYRITENLFDNILSNLKKVESPTEVEKLIVGDEMTSVLYLIKGDKVLSESNANVLLKKLNEKIIKSISKR